MAVASDLRFGQAKPPSVLILCDSAATIANSQNKDGMTYFQLIRQDLTTCIGHDRYVTYPLLLEDVERSPWQENCQLLIAPACLDLAGSPPNVVQNLVRYVEEGGRCLAMNKRVIQELLGCSSAEKSPAAPLHHVIPCIPSIELDGFVAPLLFDIVEPDHKFKYKPLACLHAIDSAVSCVQLVLNSTHQHMCCVTSSVDLLAPSFEGLTVSMISELKQSAQARHSFLGAVLQQLGVEYVPSSIPSLSHTYLFTRTNKVRSKVLMNNRNYNFVL